MLGHVNDWFRSGIARCVRLAGLGFSVWFKFRLLRFEANQKRLKRTYVGTLNKTADGKLKADGRFALTSGSAGEPKRILYTAKRLRACKWIFTDMFARACRAFRIGRASLYVFSSFEPDDSVTSMLLHEVDLPNYFVTLQAPYRVQRHHAMRALAAEYGATAVRLWLVTISNPGVFYSTNPSTISTFFDDVSQNWPASSKLIRSWCKDRKRFNSDVRKIARRLASTGSDERLHAVANSNKPLPIDVWAPGVEAYVCWTGGYVKPFLDQLRKYLPAPRYRLIPMYSMSTETIETLAHFANDDIYFLPLAPGVVYEFVEYTDHPRLNKPTEQARLLNPSELEPGKLYEMIVSDAYGLRRYHTADLFLRRRMIDNLPDLLFQRRRGLEYSFTGEKLTAEQVSIVFEQLCQHYPRVCAGRYLTCLPSVETIPHYKVLLIGDVENIETDLHDVAARCDELLGTVNCEYRTKRASGRLGPVEFIQTGTREFAEGVFGHNAWESQFKFLPLCPHLICTDTERVS
jgi:GH3 auxin-responsive promoter